MPAMEFPGLKQKLDCSLFTQPNQDKTQILCIYCLDSPVPAAKSCLLCEAHLCDRHLAVHSNSADHVLLDPTTSLGKRKCSVHGRILEYYCTKDTACICVSCRLDGEHIGHRVETLDEASEKKKEKMGDILQKLNIKKEETEKNVHSLQKLENKTKESTACVKGRVTGLVKDIKKQLKVLEKSALREISRQEKFSLLLVSSEICQLEIMKDELSGKIRHIEELCNMSDPVTVLQTSIKGDLCDTQNRKRHYTQVHEAGDLDVGLISGTLHTLSDIITGINMGIYVQGPTDILLDVTTAANNIHISGDMKTVSESQYQNRPETAERFMHSQVISTRGFSGRHYWDVDVSNSRKWGVGMCYPSIYRRGILFCIGYNNKSWGLYRENDQYIVMHNRKVNKLPDNTLCDRVRVYLDYEAGQLSFYSLCDPIRHLHTYTATFIEPLHAALGVWDGCLKI